MKKNIIKFTIISIVTILLAITFGKTYAKYILTRNFDIDVSSAPFYFDAEITTEDSTVTIYKNYKDNTLYGTPTLDLIIKNYDGDNYNSYDVSYNVSTDNPNISFVNETTTISGGSAIDKKIKLKFEIKDMDNIPDDIVVKISTTKPYSKTIELKLNIDKIWRLEKIEDLVRLSNKVNSGTSYVNEKFLLVNDLDFKDSNDYEDAQSTSFGNINGTNGTEPLQTELTTGNGFTSIGTFKYHFQGIFDGGSKKIENIYVHNSGDHQDYETVVSLFGFVEDAIIQNLTVTGELSTDTSANVGGITSYASNLTLKNVHSNVNIESKVPKYSSGGLIGSVGNGNIGLLGGTIKIIDSSNSGSITGANHVGGLIGYVGKGATIIIESSNNNGELSNANTNMGGLVGSKDGILYINNSYNTGKLWRTANPSKIRMGGLVGVNFSENCYILNSYNKNEIAYSGSNGGDIFIAGLVGESLQDIYIFNSFNLGKISSTITSQHVSGIVNSDSFGQINNVYNAGELVGQTTYEIGSMTINNSIKNTYYKNGALYSNINSDGFIGVDEMEMKQPPFATTLTDNIASIDLNEINNKLTSDNLIDDIDDLKMHSWGIGASGYPEFN